MNLLLVVISSMSLLQLPVFKFKSSLVLEIISIFSFSVLKLEILVSFNFLMYFKSTLM